MAVQGQAGDARLEVEEGRLECRAQRRFAPPVGRRGGGQRRGFAEADVPMRVAQLNQQAVPYADRPTACRQRAAQRDGERRGAAAWRVHTSRPAANRTPKTRCRRAVAMSSVLKAAPSAAWVMRMASAAASGSVSSGSRPQGESAPRHYRAVGTA